MIFFIIIAAAIFVFILFNNDRKDVKNSVIQRGGLTRIYPNFIEYINLTNNGEYAYDLLLTETRFEFVKNDGEYLEYKYRVNSFNGDFGGYYHIGIHHTFGAYAYCFCINSQGRKIEGFMRELHNGRSSNPLDRSVENYQDIYFSLVNQMQNLPNFEDKFYFNL